MATKHTPSSEMAKYFPNGEIGAKLEAKKLPANLRVLPPSKIRFLGRDIKVEILPKAEMKDLAGQALEETLTLQIADGQIPIEEIDTVFHELIHIVDYLLSLGLSERQVRLLASSIIGIFQDNVALTSYLTTPIKDNT